MHCAKNNKPFQVILNSEQKIWQQSKKKKQKYVATREREGGGLGSWEYRDRQKQVLMDNLWSGGVQLVLKHSEISFLIHSTQIKTYKASK